METPSLSNLSDELLLCILDNLGQWERQETLLNLSLVNRRSANLAQNELHHSASIHPKRAHHLVAHVLNNCCLAAKVVQLSIQGTRADEARLLTWGPYDYRLRKKTVAPVEALQGLRRRCLRILQSYGLSDGSSHWLTGNGMDESFVYIAVLLLQTPNVKRLKLDYQVASDMTRPMGLHEDGTPRYASHLLRDVFPRLEQLRIKSRKLRVWVERGHHVNLRLSHPIFQSQFEGYDGHFDALRERMRIPGEEFEAENDGPLDLKARILGKDDECQLERLNLDSMKSLKHLELPSHSLVTRPTKTQTSCILKFPSKVQSLKFTACDWNVVQHLGQILKDVERKKYPCLRKMEAEWSDYIMRKSSDFTIETAKANLEQICVAWEEHGVTLTWTLHRGYAQKLGELENR
ncbi:hypothetical protein EK21DRAFT_91555 [Setomelanomma holmii]|uniref:F-box domain-containing protein n=1 Tax=Setomelanomma holmii TaxID=210430 RepID=A0A9P4H327_9PLEO|nr:hypothetical protein EK21DRAFT_91555 [Setomelanomma holmii]